MTVRVKDCVADPPLASLTTTARAALPNCPATGLAVTVRLAPLPPNVMLAFGTRRVLEEAPARVRLPAAVSESLTVTASGPAVPPSAIVWLAIAVSVGRSFTPLTVTVKVRLTVLLAAWPSLTLTVIVAVPFELGVGV